VTLVRGGFWSLVGAVFVLALSPAGSWAAYPGANGQIAYSTGLIFRPSTSEIFTIPPAGGDSTRLTDNAIADTEPSWSADGRRVAFVRGSSYSHQNQNVWTMRADGTKKRQVTHWPAAEAAPSFSPGGGRIVMTHGWDIMGDVVIARTDGTEPVRLTSDRDARDPVFSPDGRRIAFAGSPNQEAPSGIWVMRRNGTHKRLLASEARDPEEELDYLHPDFSPDGSHIVFDRMVCISHGCDHDDVLMRSNGHRKRSIGGGEEPVFSPNGKRIATVLVSCDALTESCDYPLVSFDPGTDSHVVTDLAHSPSWQPIPAL
jgi:Tol biopolymer transport system component